MPKIGQHNKFNNFLATKIMRKMSVIEEFIANVGDITKLKGEAYDVYEGSLDLRGAKVETLPENLTVTGNLILRGNKHITELPKSLHIARNLDLSETNIKTLPKGLVVGDDLILTNSAISALPEGLVVGRTLFLEGTQITELPKGLVVCNHLQMKKTKITTLPESLQVGGNVFVDRKAIVSIRHSQAEREKQLNIVAV